MKVQLAKYGPWAVVSGASDGIGREFARALGRQGFKLVLVARRRAALEALAAELSTETRIIDADLGTSDGVRRVIDETAALEVGLLVAAAGFGTSGDFLHNALDDELAMLDVNCRAVAALSHAFGKRFVTRGRGGLVLLSSLVAFQGVRRAANYAATKAWVQSFAEGLALVLGAHGRREAAGAVLGSVSQSVLRHAECPVLVTRQGTLRRFGRVPGRADTGADPHGR